MLTAQVQRIGQNVNEMALLLNGTGKMRAGLAPLSRLEVQRSVGSPGRHRRCAGDARRSGAPGHPRTGTRARPGDEAGLSSDDAAKDYPASNGRRCITGRPAGREALGTDPQHVRVLNGDLTEISGPTAW